MSQQIFRVLKLITKQVTLLLDLMDICMSRWVMVVVVRVRQVKGGCEGELLCSRLLSAHGHGSIANVLRDWRWRREDLHVVHGELSGRRPQGVHGEGRRMQGGLLMLESLLVRKSVSVDEAGHSPLLLLLLMLLLDQMVLLFVYRQTRR